MNAIPLVRNVLLLRFADFLDRAGAPTERWLDQSQLAENRFAAPDQLVSQLQLSEFIERAAHHEGIDTLGFVVGQQTQATELGAYGQMLGTSLTLYDLLTTIERTIHLINSGEHVQLVQQPDAVWLQCHLHALDRFAAPQSRFFSLMAHLNVLRLALGPGWRPPEIHLATRSHPALINSQEFAGVKLRFGQDYNAIKIPRSLFSVPLPSATAPDNPQTQASYVGLQRSAPAADFISSLQQLIESLLIQGYPDIDQAALASGMSTRSLQRQLMEAGLSYSKLVEKVRFDLAIGWLQDPSMKISDITAELAYTDVANFSRAFKRWTGVSPREYRLLHH
jgi:AraC-like DNA-binding protein